MIHVVKDVPHSGMGPSSAERWINCPGSVAASKTIKEAPSQYAAEGTAAHHLANLTFLGQPWGAGDVVEVDGFKFTVLPEWVPLIHDFHEWCNEMPGDQFSEIRVYYESWIPGGFGWIDRAAFNDGVCGIRDLKFGQGVQVFAKENDQLRMYALGILHDYSYLYDIQHFEVGIDQPRLGHRDVWDFSRDELEQWGMDVIVPAFKRVQEGKAFKAGKWCQFCRFKRDCKVRMNQGLAAVLADFEDLDALDDARGTKDIQLMTPEEKAKIYPDIEVLEAWIKDFKKGVVADLLRGGKIGGCKLVEGRSNRKWGDPDKVAKRISPDDAFERTLRSPAQLEKLFGKARFNKILGELVVKPPGRPTLVGADDPRPPMEIDPEFTDLDADDI